MPQLQNQCSDRCLSISSIRAKWAPKDRPFDGGIKSDTVTLSASQVELPEVQDFIARGLLKVMPEGFEPSTTPKPPKRGATRPRSPKVKDVPKTGR
jgi:hypothetical protein